MLTSVIVTTYNRPKALKLVLQGLAAQTQLNFEVIVADDGSTEDTAHLIKSLQPLLPYSLQHVWQTDNGFRAAKIRNLATTVANGDYLIFLDGDCLPTIHFIDHHTQLAETGWWVAGNRILLSPTLTTQVLQQQLPLWTWSTKQWLLAYLRRDLNRLLPLLKLPEGIWRKRHAQRWQGAKTCNLAVWKTDVLKVNGFDERFEGWGHEDAEMVVRLLRSGIKRKEGRFAVPVLHLWHPPADRSREQANRQQLQDSLTESARDH